MLFLLLLLAPLTHFDKQTLADDLKGGYQVVAADLNHDGKPDLIALASGQDELVWFENPTWKRHVLATGLKRMINCAVIGSEIVVAHGFDNDASKSAGIVSVISPDGSIREIDRYPTAHRLRVARVDGREVVVLAPLTGETVRPPDYQGRVPLFFYRPGVWKREVIDETNEGVQHGIYIDGEAILTASDSGIHRYTRAGQTWKRGELSSSRASDVAVSKEGWLASIEPWHGNQVVRYDGGKREVLDDTLADTHSIATADLDGAGREAIVVAQRGAPGRVLVYRGKERETLDEGIPAAACLAQDLDGDGRADVACIGGRWLKVYWNRK